MEIYNGTYCVYVHTNKVNGKMYVGQTCQKPERRWNSGDGYKNCSYFYKAIKKYGWGNFEHEVIASNLTLEEANNFEDLLINKLDTRNQNKGYNLKTGGRNGLLAEETKEKIKKAVSGENAPMLGRHHAQETKDKISRARIGKYSGKDNPNYGKHHSIEARKKMSERAKERCTDE
jgi:group I intron endonuclease